MSEENESSLPAILIGFFVVVALLVGGLYWFAIKRQEQLQLAELAAREAALQAASLLKSDDSFEFQLGQATPCSVLT